jgi:hypothetical protein
MAATSDYTINFVATGPVGSPVVDIKVYIKGNDEPTYTLAYTELNAAVGNTYSHTFNGLDSHRVYQVKVESVCAGGPPVFGDIYYLSNPICPTVTATPNIVSLDVSWDCWVPTNGDSVIEYRIEYKDTTSIGPYFVETIPISLVTSYWVLFPGTYPNYLYNLTTGIVAGQTYEVNLYATLEFDYFLSPPGPSVLVSQILVGPCTVISPPI